MKIQIIFENEKWMAVDKPAGILSQKDKSGDEALADILKKQIQQSGKKCDFLAPVHRLDRNTSGIILLGKTSNGAKELTDEIQAGRLHRTYLAIVKGYPGETGRYDFPLEKDEKNNEVSVSEDGKEAITDFTCLQKLGNSSIVKIQLLTGRSHQIRAHFSHAGHALIGDKKYAKKPWSDIFERPALHAYEITVGSSTLRAPIPTDFSALITKLGGKPIL